MLKSKTMWFAAILASLSVFQGQVAQLQLDPQTEMIVGCVIAAAVAVLRVLTTQPVSEK